MQDFAQMDRRVLMRNVALLLGAAAIPTLAGCKAALQGNGALDDGQLKMLTAIADTIIPVTDTPGAVAAGVPRLLSGMLRDWASKQTLSKISNELVYIDSAAVDQTMKGFVEHTAEERKRLLASYDKAALQPGPPPTGKPHPLAMLMGPPVKNPDYVQLKGLIINLYYASEIASTKELIYEHVPGKFVASMPVTPDTRPYAGVGGLF